LERVDKLLKWLYYEFTSSKQHKRKRGNRNDSFRYGNQNNKKGEYATHYMKGKSNFFLRNNEDFYHLDKVTKGCTATVVAGTEEDVLAYIKENNLKQVALLHI
jgi:hypothetical protein